MKKFKYYTFYKPFGILSQFSDADGHKGLGNLLDIEKDIYPIGRLDRDSEGLLLLTNDQKLNHKLLNPRFEHWRTYLVQVEGIPEYEHIQQLEQGVMIRINKKDYKTKPCKALAIPTPNDLPERNPPIRYRKTVPTSWLQLSLTEGKNRQVRKMTAQIGFPTLRLIRSSIEQLHLQKLMPGELQEFNKANFYKLLAIA